MRIESLGSVSPFGHQVNPIRFSRLLVLPVIQSITPRYTTFLSLYSIFSENGRNLLNRALPFYRSANRDAIDQIITSFRQVVP